MNDMDIEIDDIVVIALGNGAAPITVRVNVVGEKGGLPMFVYGEWGGEKAWAYVAQIIRKIDAGKQVFEMVTSYDEEDSGAARIMELSDSGDDTGMFVRVQSYDTSLEHSTFDPFLQAHKAGKKIRVTVEIVG
jgi:hypothetical protein